MSAARDGATPSQQAPSIGRGFIDGNPRTLKRISPTGDVNQIVFLGHVDDDLILLYSQRLRRHDVIRSMIPQSKRRSDTGSATWNQSNIPRLSKHHSSPSREKNDRPTLRGSATPQRAYPG